MPSQLGYATVALAIAALILLASSRLRLERWSLVLLGVWFITGYILFSLISVREPRHDLMILFPVILLAGLALARISERCWRGSTAILLPGLSTYGYSVALYPPSVVAGYRDVADYVAQHAPPDNVVVFSGYRDGNFVFDMREHAERHDLTLLRADKLLLRISVERIRGVQQADLQEADIATMLRDNGVAMIVAQRNFWQDLQEMARFTNVLNTQNFRLIASFPLTGNLEMNDGRDESGKGGVDIFVPTYPIEAPKGPVTIDLPVIGQKVTGFGTK